MSNIMLTLNKTGTIFGAISLLLFVNLSSLKAQSITPLEGGKGIPLFLISPREEPVVSSPLNRLLSSLSAEDSVKVWVFFTDKGIFSLSQYSEEKSRFQNQLTNSSLKRRQKNRTGIDFLDLPVNQAYIDEILKSGGILCQKSRWLNAVSIRIQKSQVEKLSLLPFVRKITKVVDFKRAPDEIQNNGLKLYRPAETFGYGRNYGPSLPQMDQINVPIVHDMGFKGQNVIVCMMDTGFRKNHQAFAAAFTQGRVLAEYDFIFHDNDTQNEPGDTSIQHDHGTYTWSALGGEYDGELYGPAYGAEFVLAKTEDVRSETPIEEDNWVAGMEWADSIGAEVISSSLGYSNWYTYPDYNGNICITTIAADIAASRGIVVCNAMGNSGPGSGTLNAPADADSIVACGSVDEWGNISNSSSRGPTYDGRIKPEVVARGIQTYCASPYDTTGYLQRSGTSLSTPLIGGSVAVLLSAHPDWTVMQTREALIMTANNSTSPNNTYGWGLVDLFAALNYKPTGALTIQHNPPLFTSDTLNSYFLQATITSANSINEDSLFLFWRTDTLSSFTKQHLQPAGSNNYQAEITPQSSGTIVYYYFSAQDSLHNVVNLPLGAPRFKFKFYIDSDLITFDFEDGLFHWETGGTNSLWNWTSVSARNGTFSLTDSPQSSYWNNTNSWAGIKESFDLTDAENPEVSFWHKYQFWSGDSGFVEINTDGGKGWERIYSFDSTQSEWTQVSIPLDSYTGHSHVKFRFHFISDNTGNADGWYIDDVQINFKPTSVEEEQVSVPTEFSLSQNYPNPFNPSTIIRFKVKGQRSKVPIPTTLKIYNILGQKVKTLVDESKQTGEYEAIWDGKNDRGEVMASGMYFYQLKAGKLTETKKMLLLK
jgi:serine protease AprX